MLNISDINFYFTFKHVLGCGTKFRPMSTEKNTDSFEDAKKVIREKLLKKTKELTENAETIHILLSGGLDSCITLYNIRQVYGGKIISHTLNYTGTWEGKNTDLDFARKLSEHYDTEHYEHVVTEREMRKDFPEIVRRLKYPFAGFVSPYFASKMLPKDVPVFTGDLSDEIFGSYKGPREASLFDTSNTPTDIIKWRSELDSWCIFTKEDKDIYYSKKFKEIVDHKKDVDIIRKLYAINTGDQINDMIYFDWVSIAPDQVFYSPSKLMPQQDLSPFIDDSLIDYVNSLPGHYKVNKGDVKYILKEAYRGIIPTYIIERKKEGFVQPSNYWLFNNWENWVRETLSEDNLDSHGLLEKEAIKTLVNDFYSGNQKLVYKVWGVFCFQIWWNIFKDSLLVKAEDL